MGERFSTWINDTLGPILRPVFQSLSAPFNDLYMPWARICAIALFLAAFLWVMRLRPEYVNLDAPRKAWYADLRVWTALAMLPHVLVYLFV